MSIDISLPDSHDPSIAQDPQTRSAVFSALSGRQGAEMGSTDSSVRGMLIAVFGTSKRDPSRPDVKAAAKGLGVTTRTVQRWIAVEGKQRHKPKASTLGKLTKRARQAVTTRRGRAAAVKAARQKYTTGARVTTTGTQGISQDYARPRTVSFDFDTPEMAQSFFDAYENGGEKGVMDFLNSRADEGYGVPSWYVENLDSITLSQPYS